MDHIENAPQYESWGVYRKVLKYVLYLSSEIFICSWLIYGNFIYYSPDNNCSEDSSFLGYLMFIVLITGYFLLMYYLTITVLLLVFLIVRCRQKHKKSVGSVKILRNLVKTKYSSLVFKTDEECIICWTPYTDSDDVIKLECNEKHFFHHGCIESWIKSGKNTCPMCR